MSHPLGEFFAVEEGKDITPSKQAQPMAKESVSNPLSEFFSTPARKSKQVSVTGLGKLENLPERSKEEMTPGQRAFKENIEEPLQIFGQNVVSGFKSAPRTLLEVGNAITDKLGTDVFGFYKNLNKLPESVKSAAKKAVPSFSERRQKQLEEGGAEENTPFRKGVGKFGRGIGETAWTGGVGGLPGLTSLAAGSTAAQIGEEVGLNPWANAALTLASSYFGHKIPGFVASRGATLAKQKITPEVQEYMQASQELGIDPLLTGMNPGQIQRVAQKYATNGIGGTQLLQDAYISRSGQVARAFEQGLDQAGQNLYTTTEEAGTALKGNVQGATRQIERNKNQLYKAVENSRPKDAIAPTSSTKNIEKNLESAVKRLNYSLSLSPAESSAHRRATNLIVNLHEFDQALQNANEMGGIPVSVLEATNRSLNDVISYDLPGGADKLLIPFAKDVRSALDAYGRTNPKYATARKAANSYFANQVVHIRQDLLQSIARSEKPEATLAIMNSVSGIRNVEKALKSLPNGRVLMRALKRYKLNALLRDKIIDPSTGHMKVGGLKNFLSKKSSDHELIRELAGPEAYRTLQLLEHVGKGLERGFNNLVNPSKTADTLLAIQSVLSPAKKIVSGLQETFKGNVIAGPAEAIVGASQLIVPKLLSSWILDPKSARRIYTLSQAAKQSNWRLFNQILDEIDRDLKKDNEKYDEYLNKR